jgi:hypothetical protein
MQPRPAERTLPLGVCFLNPRCVAIVVIQIDNPTPIVLKRREKSVIHGTPGTAVVFGSMAQLRRTRAPYIGTASNKTMRLGSWRYRNGCSNLLSVANCAWRRHRRSAAKRQDLKGLLRSVRLSGDNVVLQAQHRSLLSPRGSDAKVAEPMEAPSNSTVFVAPQRSELGGDPSRNQTKDSETAGATPARTLEKSLPSRPGTGGMR